MFHRTQECALNRRRTDGAIVWERPASMYTGPSILNKVMSFTPIAQPMRMHFLWTRPRDVAGRLAARPVAANGGLFELKEATGIPRRRRHR